jgi:hypothetical protein
LYLHHACHAQNSTLYSIGGTIVFHSIFSGDPNETDAQHKLTDAEFSDILIADPREVVRLSGAAALADAGGLTDGASDASAIADSADSQADAAGGTANGAGNPGSVISHLSGRLRFYFQRGQPAQTFP